MQQNHDCNHGNIEKKYTYFKLDATVSTTKCCI